MDTHTIRCPTCHERTTVVDIRQTPAGNIARERSCPTGHQFKTIERYVAPKSVESWTGKPGQ